MTSRLEAIRVERERHPSGDVTLEAREALRRSNARTDTRWRALGRSVTEILASLAIVVVVATVLGLFAKLAFVAWVWILS